MPDDDKPKGPRLAVENDPRLLAQDRVRSQAEYALRDLTANLIRVTRGAGKPYEIGVQCARIVEVFEAYHDAFGSWPSSDWASSVLDVGEEIDFERFPDEVDRHYAEERIIRGSLQIAASRLLRQRTQEAAGDTELHRGLRAHRKAWDDMLAKREAERKAAEAAARVVAKPKKRVLKPRK